MEYRIMKYLLLVLYVLVSGCATPTVSVEIKLPDTVSVVHHHKGK